jgi:hypothetical protein
LLVAVIGLNFRKASVEKIQTVNPVLGDISFVSKFGYEPDSGTDEVLRIKTHLKYVESLLRNKNIASLSAEQKQRRACMLNLLHQYSAAGIFPRNYDYPGQRKPCFIDKDGRICAVGYLVEQTAGRQVAEDINSNYKYDNLLAMHSTTVDEWVKSSGLTKEECAMIQPAYGGGPYPGGVYLEANYISTGYGVSSGILGAVNISTGIINGIQISKGAKNKTMSILGLVTGTTQVMLGALGRPPKITYDAATNKSKRALSGVNIGVGASTVILSTWNLLTNKKPKECRTSWNIYSFPTHNNNTGVALAFTRRF